MNATGEEDDRAALGAGQQHVSSGGVGGLTCHREPLSVLLVVVQVLPVSATARATSDGVGGS
jgi:hypothetical protein